MKKIIWILPLLFLWVGCSNLPSDLFMPSFDVDLKVPITQKVYTLDSIIGKQKYIQSDQTKDLFVIKSDTFYQTKNLVDFLKIDEQYTTTNNQLKPVNDKKDAFIEFRSDNVTIDSAVFTKGSLGLNVRNNSSVYVNFTVTLPGIKKNGSVLVISIPLNPYETKYINQDLQNYVYSIPAEQKMLPASFQNQFWVKAATSTSGTPNAGETVVFDAYISDFYFSLIKGKFPATNLGRNRTSFSFNNSKDIENYRDKIFLQDAALRLKSSYSTYFNNGFTLLIDSLTIIGKRGSQSKYLLNSDGSIYHQIAITQNNQVTIFDQNNSNIKDFLSFIPDSIYLDASYKIQGQNLEGTITSNDFVKFETDFSTTSKLAIKKTYLSNESDINMSDDTRKEIQKCKAVELDVDLENSLPLNAWGKITLLDKDHQQLFVLTRTTSGVDSLYLQGAPIVSNLNKTVNTSKNSYVITLNESQINMLANAYYVTSALTIETQGSEVDNPPIVTLKLSDWFKLKAIGTIKYLVESKD